MVAVPPKPTLLAASRVWWRIGCLGFGGPAGQIALLHKEVVDRRWVDERRFSHALNFCMLLPGPEAQQLATYLGWLLHGWRGGLVAGGLFVLPGAVVVWALAALYAAHGHLPAVAAALVGLKAAVLALVLEALQRIGKRALRNNRARGVAVASFLLIALVQLPFPLLMASAALFGALAMPPQGASADAAADDDSVVAQMVAAGDDAHTRPSLRRFLTIGTLGLAAWMLPLAALASWPGAPPTLADMAVYFSKAAVVTFGGAYAVLAYVAQSAAAELHWVTAAEMVDGLGLAETTPGPLILVLEFVGFVGAHRHHGSLHPQLAGVLGAAVALWATFAPCFLWIFAGAPFVEDLRANRRLAGALAAIGAAVFGVIASLSLWFGAHVLFGELGHVDWGPVSLLVPALPSLRLTALGLTVLACLALLRWHWGVGRTLGVAVLAAAALGACGL